ncbi:MULTISPECIES: hypothetical protein [unclassified Synechocystis]|uniref:hypothetical protein n=1 Tax=unclassified Synechocystis TaxID=2640012 RepID=UPI00042A3816|nr:MULTISPECIES: hypothetical protein [unclassified Synechocystis]MCT0254110.1 RAMP superfamily protein [Synechocystis sp. CS-94]
MVNITDPHTKIPMMFRAQVGGRCQLNYINNKDDSDIDRWAKEWVERADDIPPQFSAQVQTKTYEIGWRFVTNGGQDDGVIRPVMGAQGVPFYPGSSMKGAFRRVCNLSQRERYCGKQTSSKDMEPGILRFHGGYPTDKSWQEKLVDIVHPQQGWQVQSSERPGSAFALMSLYQPELRFGISSTITLPEEEWDIIWQLWEKALTTGIGCRVSAGYGQPKTSAVKPLYQTQLKGQGIAPKLLDGSAEFRPNIFRAAIRGHALRIFGGLTNAENAEKAVGQLFGDTQRDGGVVGLLTMGFETTELELGTFGQGTWKVPTYEVEGKLNWFLTQKSLPLDHQKALLNLIAYLTRFAMILGGFGRSWRRVDHRLFYEEYYNPGPKGLIGCQWEWQGTQALMRDVKVRRPEHLSKFLAEVQTIASTWLELKGFPVNPNNYARNWREAWHPEKVKIFGCLTDGDYSEAIEWFHGPYREANSSLGTTQGSIYRTSVTGRMSQIGRIWHRMYPVVKVIPDPAAPNGRAPQETANYLEFLTIFPDDSPASRDFVDFLTAHEKFQLLWPN